MDLIFDEVFKDGILNKYKIERITGEEYWKTFYDEFQQDNLSRITIIRDGLLTDEQKEKREYLESRFNSNKIENYIKVKDGNLNIALFRGEQKEVDIYYMRHAIVKKDYRGLGIYNDYLDKVIKYCKERGFLQIVSCFVLSNIDIYRTKIKKKFYITSMETHAEWGQIGWLCYFLNEDLRKAFLFRCGNVEFSKNIFNNSEGSAEKLFEKIKEASF
jgi:ribosomal protein S18 acetylase RimI-like enzyme